MYRIIIDGQYVPIPPEKITIKVDGDNKTMTLINLGEINVIRKKKLTDISFELLLPNQRYPFAYYPQGYMTADSYIKKYRKLQRNKSPFKFSDKKILSGFFNKNKLSIVAQIEIYIFICIP